MKSQKGSTLLEALIALVIFAIGTLGSMSFQSNMIAQSLSNSIRLEAIMYLSSLVGAIESSNISYECYIENSPCAPEYINNWLLQLKTIKGAKNIAFKSELKNEVLIMSISWGTLSEHKVTSLVRPIGFR